MWCTEVVNDALVGCAVGLVSGFGSFVFLRSLDWATSTRLSHPWLLALLPIAGFVVGFVQLRFSGAAARAMGLILDDVHDPDHEHDAPPPRMAPLALVGSTITHLFGGSGGREGAALQIAAGLSAPLRRILPGAAYATRRRLAIGAIAGGFGSVFGVPFAGVIFALEVPVVWRVRFRHVVTAVAASFVGDRTARVLGVRHAHYVSLRYGFSMQLVFGIVAVGVGGGLCARAFIVANRRIKGLMQRLPTIARPGIGGALVVAGVWITGTRAYLGLSLPLATFALIGGSVATGAFAIKLAFTAVTLGSGFPGGEVTPLFCVGACFGSTVASVVGSATGYPGNLSLRVVLATVGFVVVFAAGSHTPVACSIVAVELFGFAALPPTLVACIVASAVCHRQSIYGRQRIVVDGSIVPVG